MEEVEKNAQTDIYGPLELIGRGMVGELDTIKSDKLDLGRQQPHRQVRFARSPACPTGRSRKGQQLELQGL